MKQILMHKDDELFSLEIGKPMIPVEEMLEISKLVEWYGYDMNQPYVSIKDEIVYIHDLKVVYDWDIAKQSFIDSLAETFEPIIRVMEKALDVLAKVLKGGGM